MRKLNYSLLKTGIRRIQRLCTAHITKRVPFSHAHVVAGWDIDNPNIAHYASRLYREVKMLEKALNGLQAKKSLEIGCGYGRLTPWIKAYSQNHVAVEPEDKLRKDAETLNPDVKFYKAKAQKLPFPDNTFDLIVTWTVLQHIPTKEQIKAIDELKRIAKDDAVFIIAEGTSGFKGKTEWFTTVEEYKKRFAPYDLVQSFERKLEETAVSNQGTVMRFQKDLPKSKEKQ